MRVQRRAEAVELRRGENRLRGIVCLSDDYDEEEEDGTVEADVVGTSKVQCRDFLQHRSSLTDPDSA